MIAAVFALEAGPLASVSFEGDLDVYRLAEVREALKALRSTDSATVNLHKVGYFDATILGSIVELAKARSQAGLSKPTVITASPLHRQIFEITNLDEIVELRSR